MIGFPTSQTQKERFVRGSSTAKSKGAAHGAPFLTFGWLQPSNIASHGSGCVGVVGWVQQGVVFGWCTKVKKGKAVDVIRAARAASGIDARKFTLHSDK